MMTKKLNAAAPMMAPGPRLPASKRSAMMSITERMISGAEDPRAMRLRLAMVLFQIFTRTIFFLIGDNYILSDQTILKKLS